VAERRSRSEPREAGSGIGAGVVLASLMLACGGATTTTPPVEEPRDPPEVAVSLRLLEGEPDENEMPVSEAQLAVIEHAGARAVHPLGDLHGVCAHEAPEEGELLQVRCWWAGAGAIVSVSQEGDELVVRRRAIDEESGVGEAEETFRTALPAGAVVDPVRTGAL